HDIAFSGRKYHLAVIQTNDAYKYITFDITEIEDEEKSVALLVLIAAFLSILFSSYLIYWLSTTVIAPVKKLAYEVANIDVNQRNIRIADKFEDVEVSSIAKSFDQYLDRVDRFIEREQSFASTASHELRTPLSIILTSAELLREKADIPTSYIYYLDNIQRHSEQMSEIITALLFLSREHLQSKPPELTENICIKEVVDKILMDFNLDINTKSSNIRIISSDDSTVNAQYSHVYIVIKNILINAVKYSNNQAIKISINNSMITVADEGPGITVDQSSDLFEKGIKGSNSKGSGLGLFIVKAFCDYYQWQVNLSSSPPPRSGTTVTIQF
ncbi:MAG: HAMP domain-containing sensor histidine kinase, partial [Gammaproteobacteria bacterium]